MTSLKNRKTIKKWGGVFIHSIIIASMLSLLFTPAQAFDFISSNGEKKVSVNKGFFISQSSNNRKIKSGSFHHCLNKNAYQSIIKRESLLNNIEVKLITAIVSAESCFNPKAISPKGAKGLMQLMPFTAKRFGVIDTFNPSQNISGGAKYLRFLIKRFHGDLKLAIAAYNAGEGAVDHYGGMPPYKETIAYVKKVLRLLGDDLDSNNDKKQIKEIASINKCHSNLRLRIHTYAVYGNKYIKRFYIHRKGEKLAQISKKVNISLNKILEINSLSNVGEYHPKVKNLLISECKIA